MGKLEIEAKLSSKELLEKFIKEIFIPLGFQNKI
jgi:hypothetical protein